MGGVKTYQNDLGLSNVLFLVFSLDFRVLTLVSSLMRLQSGFDNFPTLSNWMMGET